MAKRGKKVVKEHYEMKFKKHFQHLIEQGKPEKKANSFLGFKLKQQDDLWRWDTLEAVK
jgi:hypothetical protein